MNFGKQRKSPCSSGHRLAAAWRRLKPLWQQSSLTVRAALGGGVRRKSESGITGNENNRTGSSGQPGESGIGSLTALLGGANAGLCADGSAGSWRGQSKPWRRSPGSPPAGWPSGLAGFEAATGHQHQRSQHPLQAKPAGNSGGYR